MSLANKVKTALDEVRLLILGAQVLFGFQLHGVFQEMFERLPYSTRLVNCAGQVLMSLAIALLIAPSMQHRLVEGGEDTNRIHRVATRCAGWALLPFGTSLGLDVYVVFDHLYGRFAALVAGAGFCLLAAISWYGIELAVRSWMGKSMKREDEKPTPLPAKVDQMLTEARVILPGAQALLGFQLTVTLTRAFGELPDEMKLLHAAALCAVGLAVVLLMTPAALHRISFAGEDTDGFLRLGSVFVIAAPAALALGLAGDLFVAVFRSSQSTVMAFVCASAALVCLATFWYAVPLAIRHGSRRSHTEPGR